MSAASLLALLRRLRVHGALSLRQLVRSGADEFDLRTLVETGLAAGTPDGLALTDEGAVYSFTDEPSLESLLDEFEQACTVANLQALLETPEPASSLSDEDELPTPHPLTERDWS
jgi:hypothetical protein